MPEDAGAGVAVLACVAGDAVDGVGPPRCRGRRAGVVNCVRFVTDSGAMSGVLSTPNAFMNPESNIAPADDLSNARSSAAACCTGPPLRCSRCCSFLLSWSRPAFVGSSSLCTVIQSEWDKTSSKPSDTQVHAQSEWMLPTKFHPPDKARRRQGKHARLVLQSHSAYLAMLVL